MVSGVSINFISSQQLGVTINDHHSEKGHRLRQTHCSHGEHIQGVSRGSDHFKVVLQDGDRAAQGLVAAAAEQGHAHVEEDGGDEGGPGQAAHTSLAALLAACNRQQTAKEGEQSETAS